jgi:acetyl esterase
MAPWAVTPERVEVPTRHGTIPCLVYRGPPVEPPTPPAVVLHVHGGAFIVRHPEQDRHLASFLATQLGVVVVVPDYDTAPDVRFPVSEEQVFDVASWIRASAATARWDADRLIVSGASSGAKLTISLCQQLAEEGLRPPLAALLIVPVTDATRSDRRSAARRPQISPFVQEIVIGSYFADVSRRREPLASPRFDEDLPGKMPRTLIMTAQLDTLRPEGEELAMSLLDAGVDVTYSSYRGVDHGFAVMAPMPLVRTALEQLRDFVRETLRR